jgi:alkylation response protein AidB-like acyl-CoA dehydrogenase
MDAVLILIVLALGLSVLQQALDELTPFHVPAAASRVIAVAIAVGLSWLLDYSVFSAFGQELRDFQAVSHKLADMATQLAAAELLTYRAAWKDDQGTITDGDAAMAKLVASEMLAFVTDEAIQILGGMGLMDELPLERLWRDARVDRIWDGTSEIQRHIISRAMLRAHGG